MIDILKRAGVPAALLAVIAAIPWLWSTADDLGVRPVLSREVVELTAVVESVQQNQQLARWQLLETRRRAQGLDANELAEFCRLSRTLGLRGEGCA